MNTWIDPIGQYFVDIPEIYTVLFKILLAVVFGAIIGMERSTKRHAAGLRTFLIISLTSTSAMMLDSFLQESNTATYYIIPAAVIIAVAILSSNTTLITSKSQIKGLTTSAALWGTCVIGLTLGAGFYTTSIVIFITVMISLSVFPPYERWLKNRSNHFEIHLELINASYLKDFVTTIRELGLLIDDIEINTAYANSGLSVYSISLIIVSNELKQYKTHKEIIEALRSLKYVYHIEEMN